MEDPPCPPNLDFLAPTSFTRIHIPSDPPHRRGTPETPSPLGLMDEQGTSFYEFGVMGSEGKSDPSTANMGEIERIKGWLRSGIDAGVGNDAKTKEALLDEAMRAFALHKDIFDEINAPGSKTPNPDARTSSSVPSSSEPENSKALSVSSVLTFMLTVGLAHFIIVVGGLSGSRGYEKLEAVHTWITGTVSPEG